MGHGCHELPTLDEQSVQDKESQAVQEGSRLDLGQDHLAGLPTSGDADSMPWTGANWPMYRDSINERWRVGAHSPAEKYDDAVHGWRPTPFSEFSPEENGFAQAAGVNTTCISVRSQRQFIEILGRGTS